jgi:hypothetical protein
VKAGSIAGSIDKDGYRVIKLFGKAYPASQLAWLIVHGEWAGCIIDHIDQVKDHDFILNLRKADSSTNGANRGKQVNNTSGFKGIRAKANGFTAQLTHMKTQFYLGFFDTAREASKAYEKKARELWGEYSFL